MGFEKAVITNCLTNDRIVVMFNPEEYTVNRGNNFAQANVPGLRGPLLQFVSGELQTLEMELFFDTFESHYDVRNETNKIIQLMDIASEAHAPPPLLFVWGEWSFTCVLARVSQKFILFFSDGKPARARLQVMFQEFVNPVREAQEIKRNTADYSKLYIVSQGEDLSSIAVRVYQNPALWRVIALSNDIDDPSKLSVGRQLMIPRLPYCDPESGELFR